jgi:hypothetical protein
MLKDIETIHQTMIDNLEALSKIDFGKARNYHLKLNVLDKQIRELEQERQQWINDFCEDCPHPKEFLALADFKSGTFMDLMPLRICKMCGATEQGWMYNHLNPRSVNPFHVFDSDLPKIDRDELYKLRRKIYEK